MSAAAKISFIVPAAGKGLRMAANVPKQYLRLAGQPVLQHTLERLLACKPDKLVLVVAKDDIAWQKIPCTERCIIAEGGASRAESVLNGLQHLDDAVDNWVLVHDSVRPCVRAADIQRLISSVVASSSQGFSAGGLLGTAITDTLKHIQLHESELHESELHESDFGDSDQVAKTSGAAASNAAAPSTVVAKTLPREAYWLAQTPQMFSTRLLRQALNETKRRAITITDEASAIEQLGHQPLMVAGNPDNLKITTQPDMLLAGFYLQQQQLELAFEGQFTPANGIQTMISKSLGDSD